MSGYADEVTRCKTGYYLSSPHKLANSISAKCDSD